MDPKGNSLGQINTHSRHTVGNGRRFEEREREESERESNRRVHVSSSRPLSCTCHERKTKDRPSDSERFQSDPVSSSKHPPTSVNNSAVVRLREVLADLEISFRARQTTRIVSLPVAVSTTVRPTISANVEHRTRLYVSSRCDSRARKTRGFTRKFRRRIRERSILGRYSRLPCSNTRARRGKDTRARS